MSSHFVCMLFLFGLNTGPSQSAVDFLMSYNKHIDPLGKLDTIKLLTLRMKTEIKYVMDGRAGEMNHIRFCEYHSDGNRKCIDEESGIPKDFEIFPVPDAYFGNVIKYELNFIPIDSAENFSLKTVNDSITVIEKDFKSKGKHIYTFNSKTKDLLQLISIHSTGAPFGYTNFQSYQTVSGIIVPKIMAYSNNSNIASLELQASASVEIQAVEFK